MQKTLFTWTPAKEKFWFNSVIFLLAIYLYPLGIGLIAYCCLYNPPLTYWLFAGLTLACPILYSISLANRNRHGILILCAVCLLFHSICLLSRELFNFSLYDIPLCLILLLSICIGSLTLVRSFSCRTITPDALLSKDEESDGQADQK